MSDLKEDTIVFLSGANTNYAMTFIGQGFLLRSVAAQVLDLCS